MDPRGADHPCIVQALPSADPNDAAADIPCIVQALAASPSKALALPPAPKGQPPPSPSPAFKSSRPPSPRRTRSGRAPEWTAAESLALVAAVAAVDDDGWARSVSAFQKWAIVAENIASYEAGGGPSRRRGRAAGECKRKWEALVAEYGVVRRWEARTLRRYWGMSAAARRKAGLPAEFDAEVYGIMDALIRVDEALLAGAGGVVADLGFGGAGGGYAAEVGEEEGCDAAVEEEEEDNEEEDNEAAEMDGQGSEEEMQVDGGNANASEDLEEGCEMETDSEPKKCQMDAWELANKLNENAQHIHMILSGEADEDAGHHNAPTYVVSPDAMETTRQKAGDLIKSLGGLVSYLNQFTDLIKENGVEESVGVN